MRSNYTYLVALLGVLFVNLGCGDECDQRCHLIADLAKECPLLMGGGYVLEEGYACDWYMTCDGNLCESIAEWKENALKDWEERQSYLGEDGYETELEWCAEDIENIKQVLSDIRGGTDCEDALGPICSGEDSLVF